MTRFVPLEAAFGEQIAAEFQRAGNRGAPGAVRRMGGKLRDHPLGVGPAGDHRPRHDDMLRGRSGPFDIGDGDLAIGAVGDRLQHIVMRQRRRIAVTLDLEFVRRHRQRNVDRQHQLDIDRLGGMKRRRSARASAPARRCLKGNVVRRKSRHAARVSENRLLTKEKGGAAVCASALRGRPFVDGPPALAAPFHVIIGGVCRFLARRQSSFCRLPRSAFQFGLNDGGSHNRMPAIAAGRITAKRNTESTTPQNPTIRAARPRRSAAQANAARSSRHPGGMPVEC